MNSLSLTGAAAISLAFLCSGSALTSTIAKADVFYETSSDLVLGIGDQIGSLFDKISLGPYASTFVAPEIKFLNPLTFVYGVNTNGPVPYTADGDLTDTITVGTTIKTVSIPFVATIGASSDALSVPSATFVVGGYQFVTLPLTFADVSDTQTQILEATISAVTVLDQGVPEPSTWTMMLAGFAGLGYAGYRASQRTAADLGLRHRTTGRSRRVRDPIVNRFSRPPTR